MGKRLRGASENGYSGLGLAYSRGRGALLHLFERDVLFVSGNCPLMTERISQGAGPIPIELIFDRAQHFCAGGKGPRRDGIHIIDIKQDAYRRAAQ